MSEFKKNLKNSKILFLKTQKYLKLNSNIVGIPRL